MDKNSSIILDNTSKIKRGYLDKNFEFFHLRDQRNLQFEYHYHDFNKIIIFISGNVTYLIEGKAYKLKPWDILFIDSSEVHKPLINVEEPYERIVLWVNTSFLKSYDKDNFSLINCFKLAIERRINVLRLDADSIVDIKRILYELDNENKNDNYGSFILKNNLFLQLMIYFNRLFLKNGENERLLNNDIKYDKAIINIIDYINENISEELSIEILSEKFYISKYYLMHKFKVQTGYTVHNYILQKRLMFSLDMIKKGSALYEVCDKCGFGDYSSFVRAFKKMFGVSPKNYYKVLNHIKD